MKKSLLLISIFTFFGFTAFSQTNGDYRSAGAGGDWNDPNSWEVFSGTWIPAVTSPTDADGIITVRAGDLITVTDAQTADEVIVEATAALTVSSTGVLTILDGPTANDIFVDGSGYGGNGILTIDGELENQGTAVTQPSATFINGTYTHNQNGGNVLLGSYANGSTLRVENMTTTTPGNLSQIFYNIEWNSPAQAAPAVLSSVSTINNDFIIEESNNFAVLFATNTGASRTVNVGNNIEVYGNGFFFVAGIDNVILNVGGDMILNSGANNGFAIANNGTSVVNLAGNFTNTSTGTGGLNLVIGTGNGTLNVEGDFTFNSGNLSKTGSGTATIVFTGTTAQNYTFAGNNNGAIDFVVDADAILNLGTSQIGGQGDFTLEAAGTLQTASTSASGAIGGSITLTGTETYETGSFIVFNGSGPQFFGSTYPANPGFTLNNASGATLANDVTIGGPFVLTAGNITLQSNTLTLSGAITSNGNLLNTISTSNLVINGTGGTGTLTLAGQEIGDLTYSRPSGTLLLSGALDVIGDLTITAGTLQFTDLTISGGYSKTGGNLSASTNADLTIQGTGTFGDLAFLNTGNTLDSLIIDRSGATVNLTSTATINGALVITNGTFNNSSVVNMANNSNLLLDGSASFTGTNPIITTGSYNVTYTGTIGATGAELPPTTEVSDLGTLTIDGVSVTLSQNIFANNGVVLENGDLIANGNNITVRNGNWEKVNGSFNAGTSTVTFSGTSSIIGTTTTNFHNLTKTSTGNLTFPSNNIRITGTLSLASSGSFSANGGKVILAGSAGQTVAAGNNRLNNIDITNGSRTVTISNPLSVGGLIEFLSTSITVASGAGNLTLLSETDAADGVNGRIGVLTTGSSVTGNVVVQRYMSAETLGGQGGLYRYISSPVADATVEDWQDDFPITGSFTGTSTGAGLTTNASMFYWDETLTGDLTQGYVAYPVASSTEPLVPGVGYAAWVFGDAPTVIDVEGVINQGQIDIPVTFTNSGDIDADGWNLIGNPYPSSINWDNPSGWDRDDIYSLVVVRDNGGGGIYRYWNGAPVGTRTVLPDGEIGKGQAFWVAAVEGLQSSGPGTVSIFEEAKQSESAEFYRTNELIPNRIIIALDWYDYFDEALIVLDPEATNEYDHGLDMPKFNNAYFDISTTSTDGKSLAFNYMQGGGCAMEIPINVADVWTDQFTMSFRDYESLEVPYEIMLKDNYTGEMINVRETPSVTFSVDTDIPESFGPDRFRLILSSDISDIVSLDTEVISGGNICQGGDASITIPSSQAGVGYQLIINEELYGEGIEGNGEAATFEIPNDVFVQGENTVRIQASVANCGTTIELDTSVKIVKADLAPEISIEGNRLISNYADGNQWYFNGEPIEGATGAELVVSESGTYTLEITQSGCSAQASAEYVVTDTDDLIESGIALYPVPANNQLTILVNFENRTRGATLTIYNATGELMLSKDVSNGEHVINVANWVSGVYLVKISNEQGSHTKRFVKK